MGAAGSVALTVSRPAFGSFSDAKGWELKLVSEYYDCGKAMDDTMFGCTASGTDSADAAGPQVLSIEAINDYYALTFSEPITTAGCTGSFTFGSTVVMLRAYGLRQHRLCGPWWSVGRGVGHEPLLARGCRQGLERERHRRWNRDAAH
jgi:hypothetical protein